MLEHSKLNEGKMTALLASIIDELDEQAKPGHAEGSSAEPAGDQALPAAEVPSDEQAKPTPVEGSSAGPASDQALPAVEAPSGSEEANAQSRTSVEPTDR